MASADMNLSAINLFGDNIEQLITNSIIEVSKCTPEPTFEKTTNDIKDNHLKNITSIDMNVSSITSNRYSSSSEHIKPTLVP